MVPGTLVRGWRYRRDAIIQVASQNGPSCEEQLAQERRKARCDYVRPTKEVKRSRVTRLGGVGKWCFVVCCGGCMQTHVQLRALRN